MKDTAGLYGYILEDQAGDEILSILGSVPKRWGRMDAISRLAVVEVGRFLLGEGLLDPVTHRLPPEFVAGLIAGTRRGSLVTDIMYAETLKQGVGVASPLLFSYTLANIALAEAASHYGITGPVYSIYSEDPLKDARLEARRWVSGAKDFTTMIAGTIDFGRPGKPGEPETTAIFEMIR